MPWSGERNTGGQKWVAAPYQSPGTSTSAIMGVWISDDEEVEWHWVHGLGGSYVNGYTVTKKVAERTYGDEG